MLTAKDYTPYPEGVYRSGDAAHSHMPAGLIGILWRSSLVSVVVGVVYKPGVVEEGKA
jgi:hypothetical protein